ncbi:FtsH protease activity modulator HflK [Oceanispirochaeta sp.]|jgi:membrane protease subunit HflK|uniref:FtsH protease activity modulator HflK n=1 Tax=Oceanispirochaeta sp. TaxID=2035350 RepID=UPI0026141220|nr:FtsH protease activity modulator HflK [Oceanispirochaeta sp.]MDA3958522.1 FtsH protease activity modulator HflK [Oceanispirochaeta sp.]
MPERDVSPEKGKINLPMKPKYIWIILIVVIAAFSIMSGVYVVDQTEEAVVLTLGKYNRTTGAGLQYKIPLGVERAYKVPTKVIQTMQFGFRTDSAGINTVYSKNDYSNESLMLTGDLNIVDVSWIIQYRIVDPQAWLFNVNNKEKTIRDISQSVVNLLVGDRAILNVIGSERISIEDQSIQMLQAVMDDYGMGIQVTTVKLQNIVPPVGEVQDAFEDVNKAIQDMNRLINEGKEAYNKEIPKATGQAQQLIQVAEGYATERVNKANGDTARFSAVLTEYNKNPSITRDRLYYEMIDEVLKKGNPVDIVDKNLKNFVPFKAIGGQTGGVQ